MTNQKIIKGTATKQTSAQLKLWDWAPEPEARPRQAPITRAGARTDPPATGFPIDPDHIIT